MNLPGMQKIMMDFQTEEMKAEMIMETMGETMDEVMEGENDEEEEKAIVGEILAEIGLDAESLAPEAPNFRPAKAAAAASSDEVEAPPLAMPMGLADGPAPPGDAPPPGDSPPGGGGGADGGGGGGGGSDLSDLEARLRNLRNL